jgi:hypothetical protein
VAWFVFALLTVGRVSAQEALVSGTVVDQSGGVLPGVTVSARNLATGRQEVAVSGERGEYQLRALPAGHYTIQAVLPGFATVVIEDVELLVGQNATIPFRLKVAAVEESVTVTSEAPLVDTRSMQVAGNVDRRQMEELPINGRNWMELSLFVKGITANRVDSMPGVTNDREFQVNLDGGDRRISDRDESVRRHDGPLRGHPGPGHLEVGHQLAQRQLLRLFS